MSRTGADLVRRPERDWIVCRTGAAPASPAELVERNFGLGGNWKYVMEGPDDQLSLRLDVPETSDLEPQAGSMPMPLAEDPRILAPEQTWLDATARRLEELGYKSHARNDRLVVPVGGWQVEVFAESGGDVRCSAAFTLSAGEACREATAIFLLRAGGCVRMARGFFHGSNGASNGGFMLRIPAAGQEEFAGHALAALEACSAHFTKTVSVLQHEEAARAYLALGARSSNPNPEGELQPC